MLLRNCSVWQRYTLGCARLRSVALGCVEFSVPKNFCEAVDAGLEVATVGTEREVEEFGGSFLRGSGVEVGVFQRAEELRIARGGGERLSGVSDEALQCADAELFACADADLLDDEARAKEGVAGEEVG